MSDPINPAHYQGDYVMRIIEDFDLGFRLASVLKYILREKNKAGLQDLKKARWYLNREIEKRDVPLAAEPGEHVTSLAERAAAASFSKFKYNDVVYTTKDWEAEYAERNKY